MTAPPTSAAWMIYGANGYTGEVIAREAVLRGQRPTLAGRNQRAIEGLARELDCPARVFELDQPGQVAGALAGQRAVLHCAGPFSRTSAAMIDGCLRAGTHYLDITGEIDVIEAASGRDAAARAAGIALLPAVGFDVVPSDCLAALLHQRLPTATHLQLAFRFSGGVSPGTAKTSLEALPGGGRARIDGRIVRVPVAWKTLEVPFANGNAWTMTIPWGDVSSAYHSTGIPNIEVYLALPRSRIRQARWSAHLAWLLRIPAVRRFAERRIERGIRGPSPDGRQASKAWFWGRVSDNAGQAAAATLETAGGYQLTMLTALAAVERVLAGGVGPGFATPSRAFGRDFILEMPDTRFEFSAGA
jgi:short subunit dehydrogenase-like uncharacterized protein